MSQCPPKSVDSKKAWTQGMNSVAQDRYVYHKELKEKAAQEQENIEKQKSIVASINTNPQS